MLRAPILSAVFVLSALTLVGLASRPVQAAPARHSALFEQASSDGCPFAGDEVGALPPGHPPVASEHRLPAGHPPLPGYTVDDDAGALPPGHPPLRRAAPPPPRFDRQSVVDI